MYETIAASPVQATMQGGPGADTLERIAALLGTEAASRFVPLFDSWVAGGLINGVDFRATGQDIVALCARHGLRPSHRVLDLGCGIGRITLPLLDYLDRAGSYEGLDVEASGIDWLRRHVTPAYPAFRFGCVGKIYSGLYNPEGDTDPKGVRFPYPGDGIDFAVCISVFSHMTPPGVATYLAETARVLRPGGRLLCTAYLLDEAGARMADQADSVIHLPHRFRGYRVQSLDVPEWAVGLDEAGFLRDAGAAGLRVHGAIERGPWRRELRHTGQDVVVLVKDVAA